MELAKDGAGIDILSTDAEDGAGIDILSTDAGETRQNTNLRYLLLLCPSEDGDG